MVARYGGQWALGTPMRAPSPPSPSLGAVGRHLALPEQSFSACPPACLFFS